MRPIERRCVSNCKGLLLRRDLAKKLPVTTRYFPRTHQRDQVTVMRANFNHHASTRPLTWVLATLILNEHLVTNQ